MNLEPLEVSAKAAVAVATQEPQRYLLCKVCCKPAVNCYHTRHGCRLCRNCVRQWQRSRDRVASCPCGEENCSEASDEHLIRRAPCTPDTSTRLGVNDMEVYCPNRELGCSYTCRRRLVDAHLVSFCHFEKITCNLCQRQVPQCLLEGSHKDLLSESCCERFSAPCPHCNSSELLDHRAFLAHLESPCPRRPEACTFSEAGCEWIGCRQELAQHCSDSCSIHTQLSFSFSQRSINALTEKFNEKIRLETCNASCQTEQEARNGATITSSAADLQENSANLSVWVDEISTRRPEDEEVVELVAPGSILREIELNPYIDPFAEASKMFSDGIDCERILLDIFMRDPGRIYGMLVAALKNGQNERAKKLVDLAVEQCPAALHFRSADRESLLVLCACLTDRSAAARLTARILQCDPTHLLQCDKDGRNALHHCALNGFTSILDAIQRCGEKLLKKGKVKDGVLLTAIDQKDCAGRTPVELATQCRKSGTAKLLAMFRRNVQTATTNLNFGSNEGPQCSSGPSTQVWHHLPNERVVPPQEMQPV